MFVLLSILIALLFGGVAHATPTAGITPPTAYGTCMGYQPGIGGDFCLNNGAQSFWQQFTGDVKNIRGTPQCSPTNTTQCGKLTVQGLNGIPLSGTLGDNQFWCFNLSSGNMVPCTGGGGGGGGPINTLPAQTGDYNAQGFKLTNVGVGTVQGDTLEFGLNHLNDLAPATGVYSMNGNKIVSLAAGTVTNDAIAYGQAAAYLFSATIDAASINSDFTITAPQYGADATGVADSAAAIQSAITASALQPNGVIPSILMPAGKFLTSRPIVLMTGTGYAPLTRLHGAGMGATLLRPNFPGNAIVATSNQNYPSVVGISITSNIIPSGSGSSMTFGAGSGTWGSSVAGGYFDLSEVLPPDQINHVGNFNGKTAWDIRFFFNPSLLDTTRCPWSSVGAWNNTLNSGGDAGDGGFGYFCVESDSKVHALLRIGNTAYKLTGAGTLSTGTVYEGELNFDPGTATVNLYYGTGGTVTRQAQTTGVPVAGRAVSDGVTVNNSVTITSATAAFVTGDVGRSVTGSGIQASTVIATVVSGTTATISKTATAGASGVSLTFGVQTVSQRIDENNFIGSAGTQWPYIAHDHTFAGKLQSIQISNVARNTGATYIQDTTPFSSDGNTLFLWNHGLTEFPVPAGTTNGLPIAQVDVPSNGWLTIHDAQTGCCGGFYELTDFGISPSGGLTTVGIFGDAAAVDVERVNPATKYIGVETTPNATFNSVFHNMLISPANGIVANLMALGGISDIDTINGAASTYGIVMQDGTARNVFYGPNAISFCGFSVITDGATNEIDFLDIDAENGGIFPAICARGISGTLNIKNSFLEGGGTAPSSFIQLVTNNSNNAMSVTIENSQFDHLTTANGLPLVDTTYIAAGKEAPHVTFGAGNTYNGVPTTPAASGFGNTFLGGGPGTYSVLDQRHEQFASLTIPSLPQPLFGVNQISTCNGVATCAVPTPSSSNVGDELVAFMQFQDSNSGTITPPSGWTLACYANNQASTNYGVAVYTHQRAATDGTTFTWTTANTTDFIRGEIMPFTGVNPTTPVTLCVTSTLTSAGTPFTLTGGTAPDQNVGVIAFDLTGIASPLPSSPPVGTYKLMATLAQGDTYFYYPKSTTVPSFVLAGGSGNNGAGIQVALNPAMAGAPLGYSGAPVLYQGATIPGLPASVANYGNATNITFASSPYSVLSTDYFIGCDATGGAVIVNLPAAALSKRQIIVKKMDSSANACTVTRAGSDLIDGATTVVDAAQYQSFSIYDGPVAATWSIF